MDLALAPTPPMGWNPWNTFGVHIHEDLIKEAIDACAEQGLQRLGYRYVVLDDGWQLAVRDDAGRLQVDQEKFPNGMAALCEYAHRRGFAFGIYSCAGTHTCQRLAGSYGHEREDAVQFAEWGVDFVKYDYCYVPPGVSGRQLYARMGQALRATGRPIVYSVCNWGVDEVWSWAGQVGAHLWRTTGDMLDDWGHIQKVGFSQSDLAPYAGPHGWNDPDLLVVGMYGVGNHPSHTGCTDVEYQTHFGLWCLLAAPLFLSYDVRKEHAFTTSLVTNAEAIAIDQDALGRPARRIGKNFAGAEVWARPLSNGDWAVGLFNLSDKSEQTVAVAWESLGFSDRDTLVVRDVWAHEDCGVFRGDYGCRIPPHGSAFLRVRPDARQG